MKRQTFYLFYINFKSVKGRDRSSKNQNLLYYASFNMRNYPEKFAFCPNFGVIYGVLGSEFV